MAPGILVTKKSYPVQLNEAPFFNFTVKTQVQLEADNKFVSDVLLRIPDRTEAASEAITRGWKFIEQGDFTTAAKRFNQAYILGPNESGLYHGFAVVVFERFGDAEYADELFRAAARANSPFPTLNGDHGLFLLKAGRVQEALPLLEKSMRELPKWHVPRINLALVQLELGNRQRACELMDEIPPEDVTSVADGIAHVRNRGNC